MSRYLKLLRSKHWGIRMFRIAILLVISLVILLRLFGHKLVFFPTRYPDGIWDFKYLKECGLHVQEHYFTTEDQVRLHAWLVPGGSTAILFCHGNAGNLSYRADNLLALQELGYTIFIFDYRGYGKSAGRPSEQGLYRDARAAYDFLASQPGIDRIFIFGRSLGGAVAIYLALERQPAGLIVESSFTSIADMVKVSLGIRIVGLLPVYFNSLSRIARIKCPLLYLHGDKDEIIPFSQGKRLYEQARVPKQFYTIHGAGHNDTYLISGAEYLKTIKNFIEHPPTDTPTVPSNGKNS